MSLNQTCHMTGTVRTQTCQAGQLRAGLLKARLFASKLAALSVLNNLPFHHSGIAE